jgi:hypothetical protein
MDARKVVTLLEVLDEELPVRDNGVLTDAPTPQRSVIGALEPRRSVWEIDRAPAVETYEDEAPSGSNLDLGEACVLGQGKPGGHVRVDATVEAVAKTVVRTLDLERGTATRPIRDEKAATVKAPIDERRETERRGSRHDHTLAEDAPTDDCTGLGQFAFVGEDGEASTEGATLEVEVGRVDVGASCEHGF